MSGEASSNLASSSNEQALTTATEAMDLENSQRIDQLAKMSVLSLSDDDDCSRDSSSRVLKQHRILHERPHLMSSKLVQLDSIHDIDSNFKNSNLHHENTLARIEEKWLEISQNLDTTVKHLQECSGRVS